MAGKELPSLAKNRKPKTESRKMVSMPQPEMNNTRLEQIIQSIGEDVQGELGYWQFLLGDIRLLCVTDEAHDRMRVMAPIAPIEEVPASTLLKCMSANFDRALDARYCVSNDMLWGAFIHPLGSLTTALFHSACHQVAEVSRTFGTTFSSGGLSFNSDIV